MSSLKSSGVSLSLLFILILVKGRWNSVSKNGVEFNKHNEQSMNTMLKLAFHCSGRTMVLFELFHINTEWKTFL